MAHARISAGSGTALRVLVVDDSDELRRRVRPLLERAGLAVVGEAADGAQAVAEAAAHRPDVVLMDLRMPRMDGIQATRALRQELPGTRVVLWSGEGDDQLAGAVRDSGAGAALPKGTPAAELVATMRAVCETTEQSGAAAEGQADPRPVQAAAAPAHARVSLGSYPEHPPSGTGRAGLPALGRHPPAAPSAEGLAASERAALEQLGAADGYVTRWMVGRAVTRSLVSRRLVLVASDYVLLTDAGRRALASDSQHRSRCAPPDPDPAEHGSRHDRP
jgi:DNA-binding NarL/FixJ family response regulator